METLNLEQLRTFIDVVNLGSFSAAAVKANLSQPAISLQVRQLEKKLGVTLIERVGRKARPTAAGTQLLDYAKHIDAAVAVALEGMAQYASGALSRVRLGTGATSAIYLLPPVIKGLRQQFPNLEIVVSTGNAGDVARAVEDGTIDIGFVTLPVSGRMLDISPVLDDEFVVISASAAAAWPSKITAAELERRPVILFEPGGNARRIVDDWFARSDISLKPAMALGSVEAIKELVAADIGCGVIPRMAVQAELKKRRLVVRSLSPKLYRKLAIIVRRDRPLRRGLKDLIQALKACV